MRVIEADELERLMSRENGPLASLYMPTFQAGRPIRQNSTLFKNLLRELEGELAEQGLSNLEVEEFLKDAWKLVNDTAFWQEQDKGLALLLDSEEGRGYTLPFVVREAAVVSARFHLKPLYRFFDGNGTYYVLALSQNRVRVLRATRYTVEEVEADEMPDSLAEVTRFDDPESQLQFRSGEPNRPRASAVFHGHGEEVQDHMDNVKLYLSKVDDGFHDLVSKDNEQGAPLVVAAVNYLHPVYAEVSDYSHLMEEGLKGNPENTKAETLRDEAWKIVEPRFARKRDRAVEEYQNRIQSDRVSAELHEVLRAAHYGRVKELFVAEDAEKWGSYDLDDDELELHEERQPGDEDLLNLAAVQTTLHGGEVYLVRRDGKPEETSEKPPMWPVGAVFRY